MIEMSLVLSTFKSSQLNSMKLKKKVLKPKVFSFVAQVPRDLISNSLSKEKRMLSLQIDFALVFLAGCV